MPSVLNKREWLLYKIGFGDTLNSENLSSDSERKNRPKVNMGEIDNIDNGKFFNVNIGKIF